MNNVLENSNKQTIINKIYNERINNLTKISNDIINELRGDNVVKSNYILSIQYKIKLIKEEIVNIEYATHWAKVGTINSLILSNAEVKLAVDKIEKEILPYTTVEEALNFADIKIVTNSSCLLYIISIPITTNVTYEKLLIKAVKRNNLVNVIEFENLLKSKNEMYGIKGNCKITKTLSICKNNEIINIVNSTCLPNLLQSHPSKCNVSNNQHIPEVEEISEGLLLLNQFNGSIKIENVVRNLSGTFLIKFHNTSIVVKEKTFTSTEEFVRRTLPPVLQPTPQESHFKEVLSLPLLQEIHVNNTKMLETLKTERTFHNIFTFPVLTILILALITVNLRNNNFCRRIIKVIQKESSAENTSEVDAPNIIQIDMDQ